MRSFLLIKTRVGKEKEIQDHLKTIPEIREIHLITGKYDFLTALDSPETELDPRKKVTELVLAKVRAAGNVSDTETIIPIETKLNPDKPTQRPTSKAFVFVKSEAGKSKDLMTKLIRVPGVNGVHLLFGESDFMIELEVEKSLVNPPPQHVSNIVENQIAKLPAVHHTETYVPLESFIK